MYTCTCTFVCYQLQYAYMRTCTCTCICTSPSLSLSLSLSLSQRNITSIEQFVVMKSDDRRALVRTLSDEEYMDIMAMCSMLPHVDIEAETQGKGLCTLYLYMYMYKIWRYTCMFSFCSSAALLQYDVHMQWCQILSISVNLIKLDTCTIPIHVLYMYMYMYVCASKLYVFTSETLWYAIQCE